jgi:hypothetical protein
LFDHSLPDASFFPVMGLLFESTFNSLGAAQAAPHRPAIERLMVTPAAGAGHQGMNGRNVIDDHAIIRPPQLSDGVCFVHAHTEKDI